MKIKTSELTGAALDWAVTHLEHPEYHAKDKLGTVEYSAEWDYVGPIIEREKITLEWTGEDWMGYIWHDREFFGPTPLIAAMRCYVSTRLGDEVEMPEEVAA